MQGPNGRPKKWTGLDDQVRVADGHVQRLKAAVRRHQSTLDDLSGEIELTTTEQGQQIASLGEAVGAFVAVRPDMATQLMAAAYDDEREWLKPALGFDMHQSVNARLRLPENPDALRLRLRQPATPSPTWAHVPLRGPAVSMPKMCRSIVVHG